VQFFTVDSIDIDPRQTLSILDGRWRLPRYIEKASSEASARTCLDLQSLTPCAVE